MILAWKSMSKQNLLFFVFALYILKGNLFCFYPRRKRLSPCLTLLLSYFLGFRRVCTCTSFNTTTRGVFSCFVVATDAGHFDLKYSWHFQNTNILFSRSLKYRYWSINNILSPFLDVVNSTLGSFLPEIREQKVN